MLKVMYTELGQYLELVAEETVQTWMLLQQQLAHQVGRDFQSHVCRASLLLPHCDVLAHQLEAWCSQETSQIVDWAIADADYLEVTLIGYWMVSSEPLELSQASESAGWADSSAHPESAWSETGMSDRTGHLNWDPARDADAAEDRMQQDRMQQDRMHQIPEGVMVIDMNDCVAQQLLTYWQATQPAPVTPSPSGRSH